MDFDLWFAQNQRWLLRLATALAGPNEAEDIAQDVAVKASRKWELIKGLEHPQAYVRRMVVNEHLSFRRRVARVVLRGEVIDDDPTPDPAAGHADRSLLVQQIRRLPPRQRAVVVLRYVDDLDDAAIATALGCGPSTVRSHATRALATLRVELDAATREDVRTDLEENSDAH